MVIAAIVVPHILVSAFPSHRSALIDSHAGWTVDCVGSWYTVGSARSCEPRTQARGELMASCQPLYCHYPYNPLDLSGATGYARLELFSGITHRKVDSRQDEINTTGKRSEQIATAGHAGICTLNAACGCQQSSAAKSLLPDYFAITILQHMYR